MIRPRRDEDLERAVVALRGVYVSDGYPSNWPNDPERWIAGRRVLGAWVCEEDGQLVGHVVLTAVDQEKAWPQWREALDLPARALGVVSRFFVTTDWRKWGIGDELIARAERAAAERGLHLVLDVSEKNRAAISFYENRGWRRVGRATLPPGDEGHALKLVLFVGPDGSG